ncbi:hypothetical protein [uncultured Umboniibacter sp.]|uniref:hypothetical protein n=1 Tax=uncultured Umboniibacter sp. TaxID=1798917 RepID=UPI00262E4821|nr:hypothetical protein [uncultured Umboniibacter sp.]
MDVHLTLQRVAPSQVTHHPDFSTVEDYFTFTDQTCVYFLSFLDDDSIPLVMNALSESLPIDFISIGDQLYAITEDDDLQGDLTIDTHNNKLILLQTETTATLM